MDIFNVLTMIGGLCLFLFGMNLMGQALERRAGGKLRSLLDKMTGSVFAGFLTGLGITAIIQSSSATTVMVVGFVNSGLMTLRQAINVIMGANVGTTVTAWLLSLGGIDSGNFWIKLLKPSSFTPVLALIGIIYYMFCKDNKKKDTGMILLGFATLMFGMETMSGAVAGLKDVPAFTNLFVAFQNPILGVLAGALLTAIIQSSSASVGILQALAVTGSVSYAAAIPIIMGQNIGTTVTAMLSSIGTNKNPDDPQTQGEKTTELDERLLPTPSLALRQSRAVAREMADCAVRALNNALTALDHNTPELAQSIRDDEELCDHYEDILGTYLVKLSTQKMGRDESEEATELLKTIGDFERISDHAVNILSSAEEMEQKGLTFSGSALNELAILTSAIREILSLSLKSFSSQDVALAQQVEPLEQVIDTLKEQMRTRHILRMQQGHCSIEAGFVLSDLLTDLERTSDHCSNIAGCVIDARAHNLNLHETLRQAKTADGSFQQTYESYVEKYQLPVPSSNV